MFTDFIAVYRSHFVKLNWYMRHGVLVYVFFFRDDTKAGKMIHKQFLSALSFYWKLYTSNKNVIKRSPFSMNHILCFVCSFYVYAFAYTSYIHIYVSFEVAFLFHFKYLRCSNGNRVLLNKLYIYARKNVS